MPVRTATLPQPAEPVPIPPAETGVPAVTAEHVVDIPMDGAAPGLNILEGLAFDRAGTLYLCNTPMGRIFAVDLRTRSVRLLCQLPQGLMPSAIKLHRDGRLFATCVVNGTGGCLAVLSPEGELLDRLVENEGHLFDDMVFDARGGIYLTDLGGSIANPTSGVWYLAPGAREPHQMAGGMVSSNGIALAPDGNALWVTEYGRGLLHWIELGREPGRVEAVGSRIPYRFSGLEGPDSACIDAGGNLYVALCGQGRFLVFNPMGIPVGQVLIPGREQGRMLKSTHPQIRPGTRELYLCSADMRTGESAIFRTEALAPAFPGFALS